MISTKDLFPGCARSTRDDPPGVGRIHYGSIPRGCEIRDDPTKVRELVQVRSSGARGSFRKINFFRSCGVRARSAGAADSPQGRRTQKGEPRDPLRKRPESPRLPAAKRAPDRLAAAKPRCQGAAPAAQANRADPPCRKGSSTKKPGDRPAEGSMGSLRENIKKRGQEGTGSARAPARAGRAAGWRS